MAERWVDPRRVHHLHHFPFTAVRSTEYIWMSVVQRYGVRWYCQRSEDARRKGGIARAVGVVTPHGTACRCTCNIHLAALVDSWQGRESEGVRGDQLAVVRCPAFVLIVGR